MIARSPAKRASMTMWAWKRLASGNELPRAHSSNGSFASTNSYTSRADRPTAKQMSPSREPTIAHGIACAWIFLRRRAAAPLMDASTQ